jgi:ribosomal protein S18 acetylase RimI-like enzyme
MISIVRLTQHDRAWVTRFLTDESDDTRVVSRGVLHQADTLPGFAAHMDGKPVGLLTNRIDGREMEVVTLHASLQRKGVGTALLAAARSAAKQAGCKRLWLITTNDNQPAIDFYSSRGMKLVAIHKDALARSRELKPEIPLFGVGGAPITDELEFEFPL